MVVLVRFTTVPPMSEWVVLLRGINVGGVNIKMADLRAALASAGFTNVRTILATGNVLLQSPLAAAALKAQVESTLAEAFGYRAWVVVLDVPTLRAIVESYPFDAEREGWHPYVVFGNDDSHLTELSALAVELDPDLERIAEGNSVLYWEVRKGNTTDSTFGKATAKAKYKATTTTRNVRTLVKILA
ncbi:pyridoxamine 5'-phosphate oxidase [Rhodococcus sp. NKCM2511]|nr:pyridoxamine 5'-phosphate oxidase [Rhodococcus sp. NKCM2511]